MFGHHPTMLSLQISDVNSGTGTTKSVSNAQQDGTSILKMFVYQFQIIANSLTLLEIVFLATRDTISSMETVFGRYPMMPSLQISDVKFGTGTTKSAMNAHIDGPLTLKEFVKQFQITVKNITLLVFVFLATRDTIL